MDSIKDSDHTREHLDAKSGKPIRFANGTLGKYRHVCAFFQNPEEEYRVLLPFIKDGLERGENAFHVVERGRLDDHVRRLETAGINVAEAKQKGQLELFDWEERYFPDGRFDQTRMIDYWRETLDGARRRGLQQTRLVAHMEWSLEDRPGVNDLLEYESRCNFLYDGSPDPVICTYDVTKYSGALIVDVMRTHPMIIISGILQENPFYVPPDEFLRELRERKTRSKVVQV